MENGRENIGKFSYLDYFGEKIIMNGLQIKWILNIPLIGSIHQCFCYAVFGKLFVIGEIYLSGVGRRSEKCSQLVAMMRLKQIAKGPPSVAQVTNIKT